MGLLLLEPDSNAGEIQTIAIKTIPMEQVKQLQEVEHLAKTAPDIGADDHKTPNNTILCHANDNETAVEREEGEIIDSDANHDFEYEAISSDEEFTLRQKIEALEARNLELEKIATISARAQEVYIYPKDANYAKSAKYSTFQPNDAYNTKSLNYRPTMLKPLPLSSIKQFHKSSRSQASVFIENISSEEENANYAETEFDENKFYARSRKSSKRNSTRSFLDRTRRLSGDIGIADDTKCQSHGKTRKGLEKVAKKRKHRSRSHEAQSDRERRPKTSGKSRLYDYSTSDDDCIETTNREELQAALNIKLPEKDANIRSTLSEKLRVIKNRIIPAAKRTRTRKRSRKKNRDVSDLVKSTCDTKTNVKEMDAQINALEMLGENKEEDDPMSLEEQELRLIALKSAVLKKHEERKKRQLAFSERPYSPTDSLLTTIPLDADADANADNSKENLEEPDTDPDNMEISPVSSPQSDMELASTDNESKSPVFFAESLNILPNNPYLGLLFDPSVQMNQVFMDMNSLPNMKPPNPFGSVQLDPITSLNSEMFAQLTTVPDFITNFSPINQLVPVQISQINETKCTYQDVDNEDELRARLIANLKNTHDVKVTEMTAAVNSTATKAADPEDVNHIELEADCLRSLLLSSIKQKKMAIKREASEPSTFENQKKILKSETNSVKNETHLPKIASNLKEALKRIKNNVKRDVDAMRTDNKPIQMQIEKQESDTKSIGCEMTDEIVVISNELSVKTEKEDDKRDVMPEADENSFAVLRMPKFEKEEISVNESETPAIVTAKEDTLINIPAKNQVDNNLTNQKEKIPQAKTEIKPAVVTSNTSTTGTKKVSAASPHNLQKKLVPKMKPKSELNQEILKITRTQSPVSIIQSRSILSSSTVPPMPSNRKILVPDLKPVQKLIIAINQSDSSSYYSSCDDDDCDISQNRSISIDAVRAFDNASPASIAMDSPSFAPCSPAATETAVTTATEQSVIAEVNGTDDEVSTKTDEPPNAFQLKLHEYLKSVRAKTAAQEKPKVVKRPITAPSTKQKTPLSVCHLPLSAQLEYRRLINRMSLLEKQKEQKAKLLKQPPKSTATESSFSGGLKITIKNESRLIQPNKNSKSEENKVLPTNTNIKLNTKPEPLKKKILVKNTQDSARFASLQLKKTSPATGPKTALATSSITSGVNKPKLLAFPNAIPVSNAQAPFKNESNTSAALVVIPKKVRRTSENAITVPSLSDLAARNSVEKERLLEDTESKFHNHSTKYLSDLDVMHKLVCQMQIDERKQNDLELEIEKLVRKLKLARSELAQQKLKTSKMFSTINDKQERAVNDLRTSIQLASQCVLIGRHVKGDNYKLNGINESEINEKLQSISQEIKNVKGLKLATSLTEIVAIETPTETISSSEVDCVQNQETTLHPPDEPTPEPTTAIEVTKLENTTNSEMENRSNKDQVPSVLESVSGDTSSAESTANTKLLVVTVNSEQETQPNEEATSSNTELATKNTEPDIAKKEDEQKGGKKYRSPLDHMQNNNNRSVSATDETDKRSNDLDAVLCPFQLSGQCEDKQCKFQHLSS